MNCGEIHESIYGEEIELFVFTMMGVRMGIDTEEIAGMMEVEDALQQGVETVGLHEKLQFGSEAVRYDKPYVLLLKSEGARSGIIIDHPDEITLVKIESVRPMPGIILLSGCAKALWGVVPTDEGIIFLLDCNKMSECRLS
jgi:hypothetical protein